MIDDRKWLVRLSQLGQLGQLGDGVILKSAVKYRVQSIEYMYAS